MPVPIQEAAGGIDFSPRIAGTTTVVASPAGATETIIATLTLGTDVTIVSGIVLFAWAAYTVGTSGTAVQLRLRRTNVSGTVVGNSGALTRAAAALHADSCLALDTSPAVTGQVYQLTMQVTAGAAASTVSAVQVAAIIV